MLAGQLRRPLRLGGAVDAAECLQVVVVEALDAERQAIDAGGAEAGEFLRFDRARVGFQRDFGVRRQHRQRPEGGEQFVDGGRRQQAGRAAAEEDADHRPAPDQRQRRLQVGNQRIDILALGDRARRLVRVEIAVRALLDAPRDVHIERQRRRDLEFEDAGGRHRLLGKNGNGAGHGESTVRRCGGRVMKDRRPRLRASASVGTALRPTGWAGVRSVFAWPGRDARRGSWSRHRVRPRSGRKPARRTAGRSRSRLRRAVRG